MEPVLQDFYAKFRVAELLVLETESWTWSVRPAQPTLGAGIIALRTAEMYLNPGLPPESTGDKLRQVRKSLNGGSP